MAISVLEHRNSTNQGQNSYVLSHLCFSNFYRHLKDLILQNSPASLTRNRTWILGIYSGMALSWIKASKAEERFLAN